MSNQKSPDREPDSKPTQKRPGRVWDPKDLATAKRQQSAEKRDGAAIATMVDKIVRLLLSRGHTQESFEALVGLAKGRITKWKEGQGFGPSAIQIWKIAKALSVGVVYLLDEAAESPTLENKDEWELPTQLMKHLGPKESVRRLMLEDRGRRDEPDDRGPSYSHGRRLEGDEPGPARRKGHG